MDEADKIMPDITIYYYEKVHYFDQYEFDRSKHIKSQLFGSFAVITPNKTMTQQFYSTQNQVVLRDNALTSNIVNYNDSFYTFSTRKTGDGY